MNVSIVGTGYVGLVTGTCLAEKGHHVICVDIDQTKVDQIQQGIPPIYEEGLEELLKKNIGVNLRATTDLRQAVLETDLSLIAVGTPFDGQEIDLTYIKAAARQIGEALREKVGYHAVVIKSTIVPGTTEDVVGPILEEASGKQVGVDLGLGMNPEFLREGNAVRDFMNPDRIVLGGIDERTRDTLEDLYSVFDSDRLRTTPKTAEMIKYAANSLLATMISFSNEIANLCTALGGIDVVDVMKGVHLDKRLSPIVTDDDGRPVDRITPAFTTYLEAGCGFGGSCFPKDVKALIAHGEKAGTPMRLLDAVIQINKDQPHQCVELLQRHFDSLEGIQTTVLGLAFKPGTDDIRESPALPIIKELLEHRARIKTYDPIANGEARKAIGDESVEFCADMDQALDGAQAVVLITRWGEFESVPERLAQIDPQPVVVDGRRMLDKHSVARYEGIGL